MTKLAVIGAGVGGCSAAYFAQKYLPNTKVTVFESQQGVGGRILSQKAYGANLELGAAFFNGSNRIILELKNDLELSAQQVEQYGDFMIWDGANIVFRSNQNGLINNFKIFSKYKSSVLNTIRLLNKAKRKFSNFYLQQEKNPTEIDSLFESAGLKEFTQKTFDILLGEAGINQKFIDETAAPITRTIYSQNADLGGFAGLGALIGVYGYPIYHFDEGNGTLPANLIEKSNAQVNQSQKVTNIEKTSNDQYMVSVGKSTEAFDGVIIAAPLELAGIKFEGINFSMWEPQKYQPVYTKIMRGVLDPTFFGLDDDSKMPAIVLTTKDADPIRHCSINKIENDESLVTFTSTEPISDDLFHGVFKSQSAPVLEHQWKAAYPMFKPLTKLPPTKLDRRVFYVNAIEPAISSMETSALSALNCIRMLSHDLINR
jgi:prenylcysteine oxidase / farnesylcysteine lyase